MRSATSLCAFVLVAGAALVAACAGERPLPGRPLSASFLLGDDPLAEPVTMLAFTPPDVSAAPGQVFSGTLRLVSVEQAGGFEAVHDPWNRRGEIGEPLRHLPAFAFDIVQHGSDVIPLVTGVQRTDHPYWEIMLLPGNA